MNTLPELSTGGAVASSSVAADVTAAGARVDLAAGTGAAAPPTRASSASSPRSPLRCLQVRRSGGADWLRHAGHEHE